MKPLLPCLVVISLLGLGELHAEASRKELQTDKKAIAQFKKDVAAHKKALK